MAAPTNLPAQLTSFVGRESALEELEALLGSPARLLTLTGSGGVGKTRLALRVAERRRDSFPDGVWLVELAALAVPGGSAAGSPDPALVPHALAAVLGLRERTGQPIQQTLVDDLRQARALLVFDNCEHVVADSAELAHALLRAGPGLAILATSRQPLGVAGETVWRVPSLSVPDRGRATRAEEIAGCEAVRLFLDRARAAVPGFELSERNAPTVAQLCQRLDGIPLALELAAARVSTLGLEQTAARLDDAFRLLTRGSRVSLPRQQTLRATVDWSHALLSEPARTLLRRLSVFAGGWTLAAAEEVCGFAAGDGGWGMGVGGPTPAPDVLDLLADLVERSLVLAEGQAGETRYGLLETLRQYATQRLQEAGELTAVRSRHLSWCLDLAEQAEAELHGPGQTDWIARLEREHDNVRAALRWSLGEEGAIAGDGPAESGLRLAVACAYFWQIRGHRDRSEARRWLEQALARTAGQVSSMRARALNWAGTLAIGSFEHARATALHREGLALWQRLDDRRGVAESLLGLGVAARSTGEYASAAALLDDGRSVARALDDPLLVARAVMQLAWLAWATGRPEQADAFGSEALEGFRALGEHHQAGHVLDLIGQVALDRGDHERAVRALEEGRVLLGAAGCQEGVADTLVHGARVSYERGERASAQRAGADSLRLAHELGIRRDVPLCLELLGALATRDQPTQAARLFGAADALRERLVLLMPPVERPAYQRDLAALRARLTEDGFAAAWQEGRAAPLEQIVASALPPAGQAQPGGAAGPPEPLSQREWEVARLIRRGLGNREIGGVLVISERTAERHVENIRGKLGFSARTQIAAWAAERESDPGPV